MSERKSVGLTAERHARLRAFKHAQYAKSFNEAVGILLDEVDAPDPGPELLAESRGDGSQER